MQLAIPSAVSSVYITDELQRRAQGKPDTIGEKLALHELARQMVNSPDLVLPRLVDLAMDLCDAVSGGISFYDAKRAETFKWMHLRGELEKFNGGTTPRDYSPCGITLDNKTPILVQRPERVYSWLRDANVSLPECLLVPLYAGGDEPLGTLWIVSDQEGHFDSTHSETMTELAAFAGIAFKMAENERRLKAALDQQEILTREMGHRVKNVFAVVSGLLRLAGRKATSAGDLVEGMSGRLQALSAAHGLVNTTFGIDGMQENRVSTLDKLLRTLLEPHVRPGISFHGPEVELGPQSIRSLALFFHELTTNAAKYGALSDPAGTVSVDWALVDDQLQIVWQDHGGPEVQGAPTNTGFGTQLSEKAIAAMLGGSISHDWHPQGLIVTTRIPTARLIF